MNDCKLKNNLNKCDNLSEFRSYEDNLYKLFIDTYINNEIKYNDIIVKMKYYPPEFDERSGFYHLIYENYDHTNDEMDRLPNLNRCEKVLWAKELLTECINKKCIRLLFWKNKRKGRNNVVIYCEDLEYVVILGERTGYYILVTAYPIEYENTKRKLLKEYNSYIKANNAIK